MTVIGAMRVKNEARWIKRSIESILPICDRVVVLDDHSTDETKAVCLSIPDVVWVPSPFEGLDEVRDKNYLLDCVGVGLTRDPQDHIDWIVMIDGDEVLMPGHADKLKLAMQAATAQSVRALAFSVLYLWDREDQVRVDGVYRSMSRVSAFRPGKERFEATGGANFHCGNCPQQIVGRSHAGVSLLHFGYMDREDRMRKYRWYNETDPGNEAEDRYRHMVIGDLFGPQCRFRHGGPLELRALTNSSIARVAALS